MMKDSSLYKDTRGAVMVTGLFMSTFLVGTLWFIMGMGDTFVFRDRMQEATDHGVFSASALHAKGMNLIAFCNLIMLLGTVIHIVLGIISDVKFALAVACAVKVLCWPALPFKVASFWRAYDKWDNYFGKMSRSFTAIHRIQKVASYGYPVAGVAEAYQVGAKFGNDRHTGPVKVIALSTSLIPGGGLNGQSPPRSRTATIGGLPPGGLSSNSDDWKDFDFQGLTTSSSGDDAPADNGPGKEGLPIQAKRFDDLCTKIVTVGIGTVANLIGVGRGIGGNLGGRALRVFNSIVGAALKLRYCNSINAHFPPLGPGWDSFWGEDGPYIVYGAARNGNSWFQTWGINVGGSGILGGAGAALSGEGAKLIDTSESKVAIAQSKQSLIPGKYTHEQKGGLYFAQSEMYFNCDSTWDTTLCNFQDMALYAIKWRARMVRFDLSNVLQGVVGGALEALTNLASYQQFRNVRLPGFISGLTGGFVTPALLNAAIADIITQGEKYAKQQVGGFLAGRTPTLGGVYH